MLSLSLSLALVCLPHSLFLRCCCAHLYLFFVAVDQQHHLIIYLLLLLGLSLQSLTL